MAPHSQPPVNRFGVIGILPSTSRKHHPADRLPRAPHGGRRPPRGPPVRGPPAPRSAEGFSGKVPAETCFRRRPIAVYKGRQRSRGETTMTKNPLPAGLG